MRTDIPPGLNEDERIRYVLTHDDRGREIKPLPRLGVEWDVCEHTGRRLGFWIQAHPLGVLVRWRACHWPDDDGSIAIIERPGILIMWGMRVLKDLPGEFCK
jgi:hypothetical protein